MREAVPRAVFRKAWSFGVAVTPQSQILQRPRHSALRKIEPTLKAERRLSRMRMTLPARSRVFRSAKRGPSPRLRGIWLSLKDWPSELLKRVIASWASLVAAADARSWESLRTFSGTGSAIQETHSSTCEVNSEAGSLPASDFSRTDASLSRALTWAEGERLWNFLWLKEPRVFISGEVRSVWPP
ncbi:MAG: hypothetical protein BWX83_01004 [Candidatus Cloacimonetes bacterium ADurb.Bin117]|nr:MAG: hypothetical protein BWX83_01004 [Candidatus Cloacimonetes bacterium ADurb.Bin117]